MRARQKNEVWLFGNPDVNFDSLPLLITPRLKERLPEFSFVVKDPHEEWDLPDELIIIDTVRGLNKVTVFESLMDFTDAPRLTMHDFDLLTNLKWLDKLGKLPPLKIIGLPPTMGEKTAVKEIEQLLRG